MSKRMFFLSEENKDSPEAIAIRGEISAELASLAPVIEVFLGEDLMDHMIVLISALSPNVPLPQVLYDRLVAKGYIHEGGIQGLQVEPTHAAPATKQ